jgi:hypothetical protein
MMQNTPAFRFASILYLPRLVARCVKPHLDIVYFASRKMGCVGHYLMKRYKIYWFPGSIADNMCLS